MVGGRGWGCESRIEVIVKMQKVVGEVGGGSKNISYCENEKSWGEVGGGE